MPTILERADAAAAVGVSAYFSLMAIQDSVIEVIHVGTETHQDTGETSKNQDGWQKKGKLQPSIASDSFGVRYAAFSFQVKSVQS